MSSSEAEFWRRKEAETEAMMEEQEAGGLVCAVCEKVFNARGPMENHLASRKHRERLDKLRSELAMVGEELPDEFEEEMAPPPPQASQPPARKGKKKKKKKNKGAAQRDADEPDADVLDDDDNDNNAKPAALDDDANVAANGGQTSSDQASADGDVESGGGAPKVLTSKEKKKARRAKKTAKNKEQAPKCAQCGQEFASRTAMFRHLEESGHAVPLDRKGKKK